jgi:NAD(P)H-dependent FMN reductase
VPKLYLPVLAGTVREGRTSFFLAEFVAAELARRPEVETGLLDPRVPRFLDPEHRPTDSDQDDAATRAFAEEMSRADGFVVVTPEYDFGYPGT